MATRKASGTRLDAGIPASDATGRADGPGRAPRVKAARELAAQKRKLEAAITEVRADARRVATDRQSAQELVGKDLAAWVMWFCGQFDELHASLQQEWFEAVKDGGLMHGLFPDDRLTDIYQAMQAIDGRLPLLVPTCPRPDPVGYAKGFVERWGL